MTNIKSNQLLSDFPTLIPNRYFPLTVQANKKGKFLLIPFFLHSLTSIIHFAICGSVAKENRNDKVKKRVCHAVLLLSASYESLTTKHFVKYF